MTAALIGLVLLAGPPADAKGIVEASVARQQPDAIKQHTRMTLIDAKGDTRVKEFVVYRKKTTDGWATRMEFIQPKEVTGTVLLLVDKKNGSEQFLYVPRMRRTRRISGKARGGKFMGSDFSYEDLEAREPSSATYALKGESTVGERPCDVVVGTPTKDAKTAYTRLETCFDTETRIPLRVAFFKDGETALKTLEVDPASITSDIPKKMVMKSADGHQTLLEVIELDTSPKLDDSLFDSKSLGR